MPKFVPRERKHRRLARQKQQTPLTAGETAPNPNAVTLFPTPKADRDERRQQLKDELRAQQPDTKTSSKKRKRLDKYIDNKLKKEENLDLLKKLAAHKVDTSLLQSAKKLGRQNESKKERLQRALKERNAGIDVDGQQDAILFERRKAPVIDSADSESDDNDEDDTPPVMPAVDPQSSMKSSNAPAGFGSGLKRPLELDDAGRPLIKKRKKLKKSKVGRRGSRVGPVATEFGAEESGSDSEGDEWNGFESAASAGDDDAAPNSSTSWMRNEELDEESIDEDDKSNEDQSNATETDDDDDDDDDIESEVEDENDSDEGSSSASSIVENDKEERAVRTSAFKAWADSQRNEALGFTPSTVPTIDASVHAAFKPRAPSPDPDTVSAPGQSSNGPIYRPTSSVVVPRNAEIQAARLELPVVRDEQKIMEAVHNNSVTIVCGATGSGKTTQVPQMLFENGYTAKGIIGVTQPRRVAAVSVANRVTVELGDVYRNRVAHQVRYDSNVHSKTSIKFMTDGILLREISQDFVLSKYSVVVIDEAHERGVNTDILIGMLSRIVPLRDELSKEQPERYFPLKLIVMSATLRVADFIMNERLFPKSKPPIVQAEGRQYNVTEHFARRTHRDYVTEMANKVARGHRKLPPGGFLVFLTGQDEIHTVAKKLKETLASDATGFIPLKGRIRHSNGQSSKYLESEERDDSDSEAEITGLDDEEEDDAEFAVEPDSSLPRRSGLLRARILPLYASLPSEQQLQIFNLVPDDSRLIILSTNVAETSLTIPGIRYVFDCGRSKEKVYDTTTGVQEFQIDWVSKASASQRLGRAGRTGPGHCYRLYSSAIFEQYFADHTEPELLRTPIESTVLQLKNMEVDNVVNFPFPTPPRADQLRQAERLLTNVGAIDARTRKITDVGKELIRYPVNPRYGKMLLLGQRNNVLGHTIALVAGMAVGDLFIPEPQLVSRSDQSPDSDLSDAERRNVHATETIESTAAQQRRQAYGCAAATLSAWDDKSDAIRILTAVAAHASAEAENDRSFCSQFFLREKGMAEVQQLRQQLHNIVHSQNLATAKTPYTAVLPPPTEKQIGMLKQIVAGGYIDHIAIRADLLPSAAATGRAPRRAIEVAYRTLLSSGNPVDPTAAPQDQAVQQSVYIHPSSLLARRSVTEMPSYVVYADLHRPAATAVGAGVKKTRLRPLVVVSQAQIAALAERTPLLALGKPLGKIEQLEAGKSRQCWVGVALRDPGNVTMPEWPLGAWKVVQKRDGKDWVVDKVLARGGSAK